MDAKKGPASDVPDLIKATTLLHQHQKDGLRWMVRQFDDGMPLVLVSCHIVQQSQQQSFMWILYTVQQCHIIAREVFELAVRLHVMLPHALNTAVVVCFDVDSVWCR